MSTYTAHAIHWEGGWELHVDGVGVTQVRTLDKAAQQVVDLVETMTGEDASDAHIDIALDGLDNFLERVRNAQLAAALAAKHSQEAAAEMRLVVEILRKDMGLSVSDTAVLLGVSRGRVSQLSRVAEPA